MNRDVAPHLWAILGMLVAVAMVPAAALIPAEWAGTWVLCWLALAAVMLTLILTFIFPARQKMIALIALGLSCAGVVASGYWYFETKRVSSTATLSPELEQLRDKLRPNGPLRLGISTSPDGQTMTSAQVILDLIHDGPRAMSYTVHHFRGQIGGVEMPDVDVPNYGGELLPGERRTYSGGKAQVNVGGGPFSGEVEWDISYGIPGNEPFRFARRATFTGTYNPALRRGENINFSWKSAPPKSGDAKN